MVVRPRLGRVLTPFRERPPLAYARGSVTLAKSMSVPSRDGNGAVSFPAIPRERVTARRFFPRVPRYLLRNHCPFRAATVTERSLSRQSRENVYAPASERLWIHP